jgi:hypothetical protein
MDITIRVRTVQGLAQYLIFVNDTQTGHVYYTQEAAMKRLEALMEKYKAYKPSCSDEII